MSIIAAPCELLFSNRRDSLAEKHWSERFLNLFCTSSSSTERLRRIVDSQKYRNKRNFTLYIFLVLPTSMFVLPIHLRLGLASCLSPWGLPIKILYKFSMYATSDVHFILPDLISKSNPARRSYEAPLFVIFSCPFGINQSPWHPNILFHSPCSGLSLIVRDQN